jgi:hypothetical protein
MPVMMMMGPGLGPADQAASDDNDGLEELCPGPAGGPGAVFGFQDLVFFSRSVSIFVTVTVKTAVATGPGPGPPAPAQGQVADTLAREVKKNHCHCHFSALSGPPVA